jgi:hypothetical protein
LCSTRVGAALTHGTVGGAMWHSEGGALLDDAAASVPAPCAKHDAAPLAGPRQMTHVASHNTGLRFLSILCVDPPFAVHSSISMAGSITGVLPSRRRCLFRMAAQHTACFPPACQRRLCARTRRLQIRRTARLSDCPRPVAALCLFLSPIA